MTEAGKQRLRLVSIHILFVSMLFWLYGQGAPGPKTGMAFLSMTVLVAVDSFLEKSRTFRLTYAAFSF